MIGVKTWEAIRMAYHNEEKSIREIMRETGHSYRTIKRIVEGSEPRQYALKEARAAPVLGKYKAQIEGMIKASEKLPRKQRYTASRIYEIVKGGGYKGAESTVRHYVGKVRGKARQAEVYLPLSFEAGQDAQVDWGEAEVWLKGEQVKVQLFVMRLNYSRRIFVMSFPSQRQECFFMGHLKAFAHFGGVARRLTYDNLTTAVEKILTGKDRQEQTSFLTFRGKYLFESHFCTPGAGHEKGGVEHGVGYVRRHYLVPLPQVESYQELNAHLLRCCQTDDERTVKGQSAPIGEMWQQEQPSLRPLPTHGYDCCRQVEVTLTPYSQVIVETNRYSVPVEQARKHLVAKVYPFQVEIYRSDQATPVAVHERCYGREQDIFEPLHYLPLVAQRPGAFDYAKPLKEWRASWPAVYEQLLTQLRQQWPDGRGIREFIAILQLHQTHAASLVEQAVTQALAHHSGHSDGVRFCLHQLLNPEPSATLLDLQTRPHLVGIAEQPVNLAQYDRLLENEPCL
jgi:transposase